MRAHFQMSCFLKLIVLSLVTARAASSRNLVGVMRRTPQSSSDLQIVTAGVTAILAVLAAMKNNSEVSRCLTSGLVTLRQTLTRMRSSLSI